MPYSKLERAILYSLKAHSGHYRRGDGGLPYIVHPIDVLHKVRHLGGITDEDVLCAAVLHDVVEDTPATVDDLEQEFGANVAVIVGQLTRARGSDDKAEDSRRLLADIERMSAHAQIVKLADRLSNLWEARRTMPAQRTREYAEEAANMLEIIPRKSAPELWDRLQELAQETVRL